MVFYSNSVGFFALNLYHNRSESNNKWKKTNKQAYNQLKYFTPFSQSAYKQSNRTTNAVSGNLVIYFMAQFFFLHSAHLNANKKKLEKIKIAARRNNNNKKMWNDDDTSDRLSFKHS